MKKRHWLTKSRKEWMVYVNQRKTITNEQLWKLREGKQRLMQIELVANPNITTNPGQGRPWKKMEVLYRNEGKVQTKVLVSFKNPTVFKIFSEAKQGDVFEVESVKGEPGADGKQYWEWKSAHLVGASTGGPVVDTEGTPAKPVTKMIVTEADRNRYIVRQSSLERAVETLTGGGVVTFETVTALAGRYEAWVFRPVEDNTAKRPEVAQEAPKPKLGRPRKIVAAPEGTEFLETGYAEVT